MAIAQRVILFLASACLSGGIEQFVKEHFNLKQLPNESIPINVTDLSLSHNLIENLADFAFSEYNLLDNLQITNNLISDISAEAFRNTSLVYLFLSHNALTRIPPLVTVGDTLIWLDLTGNNIEHIVQADFEGLSKLKILKLGRNQIRVSPDLGQVAASVEVIELDHNIISDVQPTILYGLNNLTRIDMSFNRLTICPDFTNLSAPYLSWLSIAGNPIANISATIFDGLTSVVGLHIHMENLQSGPYTIPIFDQIPAKLERLDLDRTLLAEITVDFLSQLASGSPNLSYLNLQRTGIRSLPNPAMIFQGQRVTFNIIDNVFDCNCDLVWLANNEYNPAKLRLTRSTCSANSPIEIVKNLLDDVSPTQMCPGLGKLST